MVEGLGPEFCAATDLVRRQACAFLVVQDDGAQPIVGLYTVLSAELHSMSPKLWRYGLGVLDLSESDRAALRELYIRTGLEMRRPSQDAWSRRGR